MGFCTFRNMSLVGIIVFSIIYVVKSGDGDITADFTIPTNVTVVEGSFFTHTAMRILIGADPPTAFKVLKIGLDEFPALNGQRVSYAVLQYPGGTVNPPHIHPHSSELLFLLTGSLEVGFIDKTNKLYSQTLNAGDMFVFPKGFVHFQYNNEGEESAFAISAFGSAKAGTISVPVAVFAVGVDDDILAKAFKTDVSIVQKIKAGLTPKAMA